VTCSFPITGLTPSPLAAAARGWLVFGSGIGEDAALATAVPFETSSDPDLPLIARAQAGELAAFDEIVRRHQSLVTALLYRFCPGRADLEDLVQETFIRAYRHLAQWRAEKPFLHWLKRIAANVGLDYCRRNKRSPLALRHESGPEVDPFAGLASPVESTAAPGALAEAQWLLSHLDADDRALLTLLYLEEMPLAEIAEHFGWSRANAKIRAFRARGRLRTLLQRHGYTFA